LRKERT